MSVIVGLLVGAKRTMTPAARTGAVLRSGGDLENRCDLCDRDVGFLVD